MILYILFAFSEHSRTLSIYLISILYFTSFQNILEHRGCGLRCSVISDALLDHQFIVTSTDAVYLYQHDSRGPCFAFDGEENIPPILPLKIGKIFKISPFFQI